MNAGCYKIVFSKRLGALVAVGEHTSGQGKAAGTGIRSAASSSHLSAWGHGFVGSLKMGVIAAALTFISTGTSTAAGLAPTALPTGAAVNAGNVAISTQGAAMTIQQTSDKASINWNAFNIGSGASVNVQQNSVNSVLLNRVVGNDPSQILGKLTANGQVVLVNPNGIVFGKDGSVAASAFTASTFGISEKDFANGNYHYARNGSTAAVTVENGATLSATAPGGYVALIGASVDNQGVVSSKGGSVLMVAGEKAALPEALTHNVSVPLSGKVRLELAPSAINASVANSGTITTEGGQVLMQAAALSDAVASITHTGVIDTTGTQGGAVTLQADQGNIQVSGSVKANSTGAGNAGGDVVMGRDVATGVLAKTTDVSGAKLESQGSFVETSGEYLRTDGISVKAKEWLLDPNDIVIGNTATTGGSLGAAQAANGVSQISATDVSNALTAGTNVTIATSASATGGNGDITVAAAISNTAAGNTLTLNAGRNVILNSTITASNIALNAATGSVSGTGNLTATGTTSINSATAGTLSGAIGGTGGLTKTGAGQTTLTGPNAYTGGTKVVAGILQIGDGTTNGLIAPGTVDIASGATLDFKVSGSVDYSTTNNTFTGTGTLKKSGLGTLTWGGSGPKNTLGIATFAMSGGLIDVQGGTLVGGSYANDVWTNNKASLNVATGATFAGVESNIVVDALTGGGTVSSGYPGYPFGLTVGVNNGSGTFSGVIKDYLQTVPAKLTKTGSGTQTLTGTNTYTGTTTVNGGTLQIGDGGSTGTLGAGAVTLANGANLSYKRNVTTTITNTITGTGNVNADITAGGLIVDRGINLTTGDIKLIGTNAAADGEGVMINGYTLQATNIEVTGTATGTNAGKANAKGIRSSGTLSAADKITLTGISTNITGVGLEAGSVTALGAVNIDATTTTGQYQGANIGVAVKGASVKIKGNSTNHIGVDVGANVTATTGDVVIEGTTSGAGSNAIGVRVGIQAKVTANKELTITGVSTGATGAQGVSLLSGIPNQRYGSSVESTTATVSITGTSAASVGIEVGNQYASAPGSTITAGTHITLTGTGATGGVKTWGDSVLTAGSTTVAGDILITGTASTGDGVLLNRYLRAARLDASRDIQINGTAQGVSGAGFTSATSDSNGQAPMMTAGGKFTLNATNSNTGNNGNVINGQSGLQVTAGGDITLNANKANTTANAIYFYSSTVGVGGNASFNSTAGDVLIQANRGGILFQNDMSTNFTTGTYTALTDISGRNITIDNTGGAVTVDATTGKATIAAGTGTSTTNAINLNSAAGIKLTAKQNINLLGQSTAAAGVVLGGGIQVDALGDVNIKGISTGATITASALSLTGPITASQNVAITGSNTNALNPAAVAYLNKNVTSTNGKIDITTSTLGTTVNALQMASGANLSANTAVNIKTDTLDINTSSASITTASTGTVTIKSDSADAKINIGAGDAGSANTSARTLGLSNAELNRITTGNLVIGDASNTGGITVSAATTTNATTGNITLQTGGNIAINSALTVGDTVATKKLALKAGGNVTQAANAAIKAAELQLQGLRTSTNFTLTEKTNSVGKLAASANKVEYINAGALEVGTVDVLGTVSGVTAATGASITTQTGDLTITQAISNSLSGDVVLGAGVASAVGTGAGGDVQTTTGITATNTGSGKTYIYTGSVEGTGLLSNLSSDLTTLNLSSFGTAAGDKANTASHVAYTTNHAAAISDANGGGTTQVFFREAIGLGTVDLGASNVNKTYGDVSETYVNSGNLTADVRSQIKSKNSSASLNNISKTVTGAASTVKVKIADLIDALSITPTTPFAANSYSSSNNLKANTTGYGYSVTYTGGAYGLSLINTSANVVVEKKTVTTAAISSVTDAVYGTAKATGAVTLGNDVITGDLVSASNAATVKDAVNSTSGNLKAGDYRQTVLGGLKSGNSNSDADNYTFKGVTTSTANYHVDKLALTGVTIDAAGNTYGGAVAAGSVKFTSSTLKSGDVVNGAASVQSAAADLSTSGNLKAGSYDQKVPAITSGNTNSDADNYTFSPVTNAASYTVGKKAITTAGIATVTDAVYGTTKATGAVTLGGDVVTGDLVSSSNTATVKDAVNSTSGNLKAGDYKQTVAGGLTSGNNKNDADNYEFTGLTTSANTYHVEKLTLTEVTIAAAGSTYGETVGSGAVSFGNAKGSGATADKVTLIADVVSTASDLSSSGKLKANTYNQKTTAANLRGDDSANYTVADTTSSTANYTVGKKALTISGITADDKTYNGDAVATVSTAAVTKVGLVGTDDVTVSATGTFRNDANTANDKNVKLVDGAVQAKTVALSSSYGGADRDNYVIADQAISTAKITKKELTFAAVGDSKTYDGNTNSSKAATVTGTQTGDSITAVQSFVSKNVLGIDGSKLEVGAVTIDDGNNGNNYTIGAKTIAAGSIFKKNASITGSTTNTTYNGTTQTQAPAVLAGFIDADLLAGSVAATGLASGRNAGTYTSNLSATGSDVGNYNIAVTNKDLVIAKKAISLSGITAANKTYDGTNSAVITAGAIATGVGTETLAISGTGTFSDKNAADGKTVTVADITTLTKTNATGDWRNYNLTSTGSATTTANINKKDVTLDSISAASKVYDGTDAADITTGTISGTVGSETLTMSGKGKFSSSAPGTNKLVTVADVKTLNKTNGTGDWNNYNLSTTGSKTTTATITAVPPAPPAPSPSSTSSSSAAARVKIPLGSGNPFQLASVDNLLPDTCSANNLESCFCEASTVNSEISICYEK